MTRVRRSVFQTLIGLGLILLIMAPGSAWATHADTTCSSGEVCLFEHADLKGCMLTKVFSDSDFTNDNPCHWWANNFNDDTSSVWNRKTVAIELYQHINYTGKCVRILAGGLKMRLSIFDFNDLASSLLVLPPNPYPSTCRVI